MLKRPKKKAVKKTAKTSVKRKATKAAPKKVAKKAAKKATKKSVKKAVKKPTVRSREVVETNNDSQWKTFREMKAHVKQQLEKLKKDFKKDARPEVIIEDLNLLGLLGGEINYMIRELEKVQKKKKPKKAAKSSSWL